MKKIISTVLALTMISNIAMTAMADEIADVEATEAVIELTDDNLQPVEVSEEITEDTEAEEMEVITYTSQEDTAELFAGGDKVIKQSPDKINKVIANIDAMPTGGLSPAAHQGENFKVNVNSTFAEYEHFSIEEEADGNKFVRMSADEFAYNTNPVSNVDITMASAREYIVSYRFRFSQISNDWFEVGIGASKVNLVFSGKRIAMNFGYGEFKNGTGNTAAYKARYQELYGKEPTSQEWTLCSGLEEGVWYTVTLKVNLNSVADGGQCFDFAVVSDDTATDPKDIAIERIPFRAVGNASENIGTLKFVAPHNDGAKKSMPYQLDIDDVESYAAPKEALYFDVTGPESLFHGINTIVTSYDNRTGSDIAVKEYIAISEDGVLKEVIDNSFFASGEGKNEFDLVFDADEYTGKVTYDVFVLNGDTGANLALKGGEGGEAPEDGFVTVKPGYGKIIANVATTDTYNAGIVTVYNGDGVAVYMADADFSMGSSVVYTIPEGTPEGNYTFEVTVSNAEGKTKTESVDIDYKKDAYIVEQFNAEDADMAALISAYGEDLGLDLGGVYATKSAYINNYVAQAGPFADADGIRSAFAEAEAEAAELVGDFTEVTAKASDSQIARDIIDFENFSEGGYTGKPEVIDNVNVYVAQADFSDSEILEEDGNKFYRVTQHAGFSTASRKTALNMTSSSAKYPASNKARLSYKIRFDTLNGGWHVWNIGGQLASLYVSGKKFGVNYGNGHVSGLKQHIFSGNINEGEWYTIVVDVDYSKKYDKHYDFGDVKDFNKDVYTVDNNYSGATGTFSIDIYDEGGNLFASTRDVIGEYCPFRVGSDNLDVSIFPAEGSVDSSICVDDITRLSYDPAKATVAYTATATKNLMPGENIVKMSFDSLLADDEDVNVYIPVYADGNMVDFVKETVSVKAGVVTDADIKVSVPDSYSKDGKTVSYDVFVLESLGGYNYTVSSAVSEDGAIDALFKADFDKKALNVTAATNLDNATVIILAPGKTLADAEENPVSSIIYMAETKGGTINLTEAVSDSLGDGDYTVIVSGQNSAGKVASDKATAYYCGNNMVDTLVADFNAITIDNAEATINKYLTEYPVLSSMDEKFAAYYAENKALLNGLAVSGKPYEKVSDVIAAFYTAYAIDEMKESESLDRFTEVFESNASIYDIDLSSEDYISNKASVLETLYASKADIAIDTIKAMYDDAIILASFNAITKDTADKIIRKYADKLGLNLTTEYAEYPHLVVAEFVKAMPFADIDAVKTAFADAVEEISMLDGDYTQTVVKQSDIQEKDYIIDFTEAVAENGQLGYTGISYVINDESVGSAEIAEEADGNKYLALKQEDGYVADGDSYAVAATYRAAQIVDGWSNEIKDNKIGFSYRVKFDGLSNAGWTYLQINNVSSLYITYGRKFGLNGSGAAAGSFSQITVQDNAWYNIDYVIDFAAKTYSLTISDENGASQTLNNVAFRGTAADIVFCPWTDQYKNNGGKSYVMLDDIKTTVMAGNALTYKVTATKDLLPGENVFAVEFNNTNQFNETPRIYIPVYVNGVLDQVVSEAYMIPAGEKVNKEIKVDVANANATTYDVLMLTDIGGFNYTPVCDVVPDKGAEASVEADIKADFDSKKLVVSTKSTYLDNMVAAVIGPDAEIYEATENPDENVVYMIENDGGEIDEDALITTRNQTIKITVNDKFGSGWYTLVVTAQDYQGNPLYAESKVYYSGNKIVGEFVSDFSGAQDATVESVINKYLTTYPVLSAQDSRLPAYYEANKASLETALLAGKPYSKPSEVINTVFSAFYADELIDVESEDDFAEVFEANAGYFGIDASDVNYKENKEEVIDRLYDAQKDITASEFKDMYDEALMIARFNSAGATTIESVLNDYNEELGLDFDKDDFSQSGYLAFRKELTKQGLTYDSRDDILDAYDNALDKAASADNSSSGGSSGGGGGSKPNKVVGGGISTGGVGGNVNVALDAPYVEAEVQLSRNNAGFVDLAGVEWAVESINELKKLGVVNGVDATHFNPNASVTREEFAKMIVAAFKVEGTGKTFADAPDGAWYTPYVNALAGAGIADGIGGGNFGVGTTISRQDAAVILDRASQYAKLEYDWDVSALYIFEDYVADYAKVSIQKLYQLGVINGTGPKTFSSTDTLTRAQAAKMIYYMMQLGK